MHGVKRRASSFNTDRIDHLYRDPHEPDRRMILHYGDLTDATNLIRIVQEVRPQEIYNLAAQSHVAVSFETAEYTANSDALGTLRLLEAIRICGLVDEHEFYQASSSEMFGKVAETPQSETTPFYPRSPYAAAKVYAYWITVNYREAYGLFACNGILFNHESPVRGETFVTRKITRGLARIKAGLDDCLYLGNLDALRDWGHARDYVRAQWLMLQQDHARGLRHRDRRAAFRARRSSSARPRSSACRCAGTARSSTSTPSTPARAAPSSASIRAISGRPRSTLCSATRRRPAASSAGRPRSASRSSCARWSSRIGGSRSAMRSSSAKVLPPTSITNEQGRAAYSWPARAASWAPRSAARSRRAASRACWRRAASALDLRDRAAVDRFFAAERPGVRVHGRRQGRRHRRERQLSCRLHPRQPRDPNQRHRRRVPRRTRKLCFLGSSCIYPRLAPQPLQESSLLTGPLEPTNQWYAIAKIAGIKMCQAYALQHGFNAISVMPTNLYGPGDNFDLQTSHVLPALLRKFHTAKESGATDVTVWGSGTPRREFLYVDDLADAAVLPDGALRLARDHQRRLRRRRDDRRARRA